MSRRQARQNLALATLVAALTFSFAPSARAGLRYGESRPPVFDEVANVRVGVDPDGVLPFVAETRELIVTMSDPNKNDLVTYSLPRLIGPDALEHPLSDLGLLALTDVVGPLDRQVGRIIISPDAGDLGIWQLAIKVKNDFPIAVLDLDTGVTSTTEAADETVVTISVGTFANRSPVLTSFILEPIFLAQGQPLTFPVTATDPDPGQTVTLSARNLPEGASLAPGADPGSATFAWTPSLTQQGIYVWYLDATDDGASPVTESRRVTIHVLDPGVVPLHIAAVFPNEGPSGTHVRLYGEGFTVFTLVTTDLGIPAYNVLYLAPILMEFSVPNSFSSFPDGLPEGWDYYAAHVEVHDPGDADNRDRIFQGFLYTNPETTPPEAPVLALANVNPANRSVVSFTLSGEAFAEAAYTVADGAGGAVTGAGMINTYGSLYAFLDLSGLADGTLTASATLTDNWGNVSAEGTVTAVKDTAAPVLALPANITRTASSTGGEVVTYSASASDSRDGAVTPSCAPASGSVFPVGTTTVMCTASDAMGNTATGSFQVSVTWSWSGVLAPLVDGGTYRLGRTLPIKFELTGASAGVTNLSAALTLYKVSQGVGGTPIEAEASGNADTGNQFRYANGQYAFNLATRGLTQGTWVLVITLGDGQTRTVTVSFAN